MSRAGNSDCPRDDAGFTLFEMLAVMVIVGMMVAALSAAYRPASSPLEVKAAAQLLASRLRDLRTSAISSGSDRIAAIDVDRHTLLVNDGRQPVSINPTISISVTGADSERRSPSTAGIRFFPNGSSTGATIKLISERQAFEIRVNWLTGRISTIPIN